jgi:glyoxylase-like metal-dependent hydrolase (beta-lactamase superfamily II)
MVRRLVVVLLLAGCTATSPRPAQAPLPGEAVAADITLLRGRFVAGEQPDGNSVLLRGPTGLVVFDTGRHAGHARRLLDVAHASGQPIVAIVNSHWHLDHVSGNAPVRAAYPHSEVYASDAIRTAMGGFLADYRAQLGDMLAKTPASDPQATAWREEIARIDAGARLFPTHVVAAPQDATLAGRRVHLGLERNAVSGGDVWLLDPATRTLLSGDLVTLPAPLLDTACARGWQDALAHLDALPFDTLVPGHGAPMSHAQFTTWRNAFDHLLACAASDADAATCKAGWLRDAGPLIPPADAALASGLLDYYLTQVLRSPPTQRDRYCRAATDS